MRKVLVRLLGAVLIIVLGPAGFAQAFTLVQGGLLMPDDFPAKTRPLWPLSSPWPPGSQPVELAEPEGITFWWRKRKAKGKSWFGFLWPATKPKSSVAPQQAVLHTITKKIGAAPILKHFIKRMRVVEIIDSQVPSHPQRKISHGEAVAGLLAYLLSSGRALYGVEKWAEENSILGKLFPGYRPKDWTDDRLGDTLDALFGAGLESIQGSISAHIIKEFGIQLSEIHYDTTSVSLWGTYDPGTSQPAVLITFGLSKAHRPDLKQVVVGMAVSSKDAVPLVSGTHNGNAEDSTLALSYWERMRTLAKKSDFCFIGDCKIATLETIKYICAQGGKILAPMAMSATYKEKLVEKLKQKELPFACVIPEKQDQRPIYHKRTQRVSNRRKTTLANLQDKTMEQDSYQACEESWQIKDTLGKEHLLRRLILRSSKLAYSQAKTRELHLKKAEEELQILKGKLNRRNLKCREAIQEAYEKVLKKYEVKGLLAVDLIETIHTEQKKIGRGRRSLNSEYIIEEKVLYDLKVCRVNCAIDEKALLDGIFLMVSNHCAKEYPISKLLGLYKRQYKVEQKFHVLKGPLAVSPMLLEKPSRICAMMMILTLALQLYTLIQRQAAEQLLRRNRPLEGLMPNKIQTWRPQTHELLAAFDNIDWIEILQEDQSSLTYVTSLSPLQMEILELLSVPEHAFSIKDLSPNSRDP